MKRRRHLATLAIAVLVGAALTTVTGCASDPLSPASANTTIVEITRGDSPIIGTLEMPALDRGERVPLVLLLHGYRSWRDEIHLKRTAELLRTEGIASLRIDLAGHAASDDTLDLADGATAGRQDAEAALDYVLDLPRVHGVSIVGYSLGGLIGTLVAGTRQNTVDALVLLAPAPTYGIREPVLDSARSYDGPVLILQGDSDRIVSVPSSEQYAEAFPRADLRVLPHENHDFTFGTQVELMTVEFLTD